MLTGACVGTNDLGAAGQFYDAVLATVGIVRLVTVKTEIGYGQENGTPDFWVLTPFDGKSAMFGNGTQIMFGAKTKAAVQAFHAEALRLGGIDEGRPGPRDYAPDYYGAYCRDLDGNKLHVHVIR